MDLDYSDCPIIKGSAIKALEDPEGPWGDGVLELIETVGEITSLPDKAFDQPFLMPIWRIYEKAGLGTVAVGRVERGVLRSGMDVELLGLKTDKLTVETGSMEIFGKTLEEAEGGDTIGVLLKGIPAHVVKRGMFLAKPGTARVYSRMTALITMLTKDEGGRHKPFFDGYRAQILISTTEVTGTIRTSEFSIDPGSYADVTIELDRPAVIRAGMSFSIRENSRTIGFGRATQIQN
ncbi:MAG: elongation factor Tu [Clostridia bacterium]|nr:elongation factor Tu [Clostridia bacterium]